MSQNSPSLKNFPYYSVNINYIYIFSHVKNFMKTHKYTVWESFAKEASKIVLKFTLTQHEHRVS